MCRDMPARDLLQRRETANGTSRVRWGWGMWKCVWLVVVLDVGMVCMCAIIIMHKLISFCLFIFRWHQTRNCLYYFLTSSVQLNIPTYAVGRLASHSGGEERVPVRDRRLRATANGCRMCAVTFASRQNGAASNQRVSCAPNMRSGRSFSMYIIS